ncbi:hypothetical protein BD413DRAFT_95289 [Trametes elegans]|nr:hypothetical protein BD413DRAFT_95289 [Trametes elegans]
MRYFRYLSTLIVCIFLTRQALSYGMSTSTRPVRLAKRTAATFTTHPHLSIIPKSSNPLQQCTVLGSYLPRTMLLIPNTPLWQCAPASAMSQACVSARNISPAVGAQRAGAAAAHARRS